MSALDAPVLEQVVAQAAALVTLGAVVSAVATAAATRSPTAAVRTLLDLLMAAGLLRLAVGEGWEPVVTAAAIIAVRKLVTLGIESADRSRRAGAAPAPVPRPTP